MSCKVQAQARRVLGGLLATVNRVWTTPLSTAYLTKCLLCSLQHLLQSVKLPWQQRLMCGAIWCCVYSCKSLHQLSLSCRSAGSATVLKARQQQIALCLPFRGRIGYQLERNIEVTFSSTVFSVCSAFMCLDSCCCFVCCAW
jgi:hypothetical protein